MAVSDKAPARRAIWWWLLAIGGAVFALYARVVDYPFLVWDDPEYVANNAQVLRGLSIDGVRWALSASHAANWHPLTWLSHMVDVSLFGTWPGGHHLSNVVLHAANSGLLFLLLRRLSFNTISAGVAALVFAVHPLHVESVVWVSERKDVLSGLFWLLSLLAYDAYVRCDRRLPNLVRWRYCLVLAALVAGLLAKQMLISLPLIFLLLDYWPYHRLDLSAPDRWQRVRIFVGEKIPFVVACLGAIVLSFLAQSKYGAVASLESLSPGQRVETAVLGYSTYLRQSLLPLGLSYFYPRAADLSAAWALFTGTVLLALTGALLFIRGVPPRWRVGWLWFLISLLPVIGLVQLGQQAHADRYMYLPLIGLLFLINLPQGGRFAAAGKCLALAAIVALMAVSYRQIDYWRSSESMYARAVAIAPENCRARVGLANTLLDRSDVDGALGHIEFVATQCEGSHFVLEAALLRGRYLQLLRREDVALALYQELATAFPKSKIAPVRAAAIFTTRGRYDDAAGMLWPLRDALLADQNGRALLFRAMSASASYRPLLQEVFGANPVTSSAIPGGQ